MDRLILIFTLLFGLSMNDAISQESFDPEKLIITKFTAPLDLPNDVVRDVKMDQEGVVWIATWGGGLVQMDGISKDILDESHGLISDDVRVIEEDVHGNLWIGTAEGISCINETGILNFSSATVDEIPTDGDSIFAIESLSNGKVWFGDGNGHVYQWEPLKLSKQVSVGKWSLIFDFKEYGDTSINRITQLNDEVVCLSVNGVGVVTVDLLNNNDLSFTVDRYEIVRESYFIEKDHYYNTVYNTVDYKPKDINATYTILTPQIVNCFNIAFNHLFIGAEDGLYFIDRKDTWNINNMKKIELEEYNPNISVKCISYLPDNSLWIGTKSGVFRITKSTFEKAHFSKDKIYGESLVQIDEKRVLAANANTEIWELNNGNWSLKFTLDENLKSTLRNHGGDKAYNTVGATGKDDAVLLKIQSFYHVDLNNWQLRDEFPSPAFLTGGKYQIALEEENIWFASEEGLYIKNNHDYTKKIEFTNNQKTRIYSFLKISDHEVWLGGHGEIFHWHDGNSKKVELPNDISIDNTPILRIHKMNSGEIWFSALGNGLLIYDGNTWRHETVQTGLKSNNIWKLFESSDGTIWAGDRYNGLMSYQNDRWIKYSYESGLPSGNIVSIVEDDQANIWVGIEHGEIYQFKPDTIPPGIKILSAPNQLVPDAQGVFSFQGYDAWNLTSRNELVYSWRIMQKETNHIVHDWTSYDLDNSALIPPLKPGHYIFEVKTQDTHRNTSIQSAIATFQVIPYFWMTKMFLHPIIFSIVLSILSLFLWWKRYKYLSISEKKFKSMVEQDMQTIILNWNPEYILTYANECAQHTLSLSKQDILQLNVNEALFSDDITSQKFNELINSLDENPKSNHIIQLMTSTLNSSSLWISWLIRKTRNDKGETEFHAFGTDITQQREYMSKLKKEIISFREFCDATQIGLMRLSNPQSIIYANQSMANIVGLENPEQFLQNQVHFSWKDNDVFGDFVNQLFSNQKVQPILIKGNQFVTRKVFHALLFGVLKDKQVEIMVLDLTKEKELEKDLVLSTSREKQKLGRDLHDSVLQELTGISYLSQILLKKYETTDGVDTEDFKSLVSLINDVKSRTRKIAQGLAPVHNGKLGLESALQEMVYQIKNLYRIKIDYDFDADIKINNEDAKIHLYQIVHEALYNAAKHSQSEHVLLKFSRSNNHIELIIQDDGVGINAYNEQSSGMGIEIMKYRASMINAQLNIMNLPEGGTLVKCKYPLS